MTDRLGGNADWSAPPARRDIACPCCGFVPPVGLQWTCAPDGCAGLFDTFATAARCPHCSAQFPWTQCPACGRASAHRAWYRQPERSAPSSR